MASLLLCYHSIAVESCASMTLLVLFVIFGSLFELIDKTEGLQKLLLAISVAFPVALISIC